LPLHQLQSNEDFSLGDLPEGHPVITREALESVADYAFSTLRGLVLMGGQVKMDATLLADRTKGSPSEKVVSLLKPAALAFLEWESTVDASVVVTDLDYSRFGFDFALGPKSYAISINAMSALALHRPAFFREAALCLARRTVKPPTAEGGSSLPEAGRKVVMAQLRASCLTLLRNVLSVSTNSVEVLQTALKHADMEVQADKALAMAKQAHKLRTATRSERNRANISYEWDTSGDQRQSKRLRETDDALAEMRAAKAAQGLGNGIQLPTNVTEAVELVLANLAHLPSSRPTSSAKPRKIPITLDFVVDAILTNGASLMQEDGRWYDRDGGIAWEVDVSEGRFQPSTKFLETIEAVPDDAENRDESEQAAKRQKLFFSQCQAAASDAMGRIIGQTFSRSKKLAEFSNQIGARLAFVLKNSQPPESLKPVHVLAEESYTLISQKIEPEIAEQARSFVSEYPLAASALALEAAPMEQAQLTDTNISLISCLLNEALLCCDKEELEDHVLYDSGLHIFVSSAVMASMKANEKPSDTQRKKAATRVTAALQRLLVKLPRLTKSSLVLLTSLCDLEDISKKAAELSRKTSSENVQAAAAAHAAKVAAEKRATAVLLILRDIAFQKDDQSTRLAAVECAVGVASGRYPSVASVQDKALKLVMNVMYPKNDTLAKNVIDAANLDLEVAKDYAVNSFDDVAKANDEAAAKADKPARSPLAPASDVEKGIMDKLRKPVILYMALAVRQTEIIETLFRKCSEPKAEVLSKTVQASMSKLARAAAAKHGAASVALSVAAMARSNSDLLLCFLENISPSNPDEDLIEVCLNLADDGGKKDVRFVTVVAPFLKKSLLIQEHLPAFVQADDKVFLRGLARMNDRVARQALLFRDEPDEDTPSLLGLTLVEQIVALHELDFAAVGIPQKRYLGVLKLCLGETDVYNDRVMMSALDQISGKFVAGEREKLPLAFMRSCILLLSLHSSLHSWIAQNLLPRLVDGKIYEDARQWEGWMRCAHMLEKSEDQGVRIDEAISKLPADQLMQYQTKWAGK
jgi:symplekin